MPTQAQRLDQLRYLQTVLTSPDAWSQLTDSALSSCRQVLDREANELRSTLEFRAASRTIRGGSAVWESRDAERLGRLEETLASLRDPDPFSQLNDDDLAFINAALTRERQRLQKQVAARSDRATRRRRTIQVTVSDADLQTLPNSPTVRATVIAATIRRVVAELPPLEEPAI